jgi:hypothetical protein
MNTPFVRQPNFDAIKEIHRSTWIRSLIATASVIILLVFAHSVDAATLTVNSNSDLSLCDRVLTYREAVMIASGIWPHQLSTEEKNQISGATFAPIGNGSCSSDYMLMWEPVSGIGDPSYDTVQFDNSVGTIFISPIFGSLPFFNGSTGDKIDGLKPDGSKAILDGTNASAGSSGIWLGNHNYLIFNLEIRNFPGNGIWCESCDNSYFRGLNIHNNGGHGIVLSTPNAGYGNPQNDTIGGTGSDQGNLIYSNGGNGIYVVADLNYDRNNENIVILNNMIGTANGINAAPNAARGIVLENAFGVTIGDTSGLTKNIISGNNSDGILLTGSGAVSNMVIWNNIGTDVNGGARLANGASGIAFSGDAGDGVNFTNSFPNRIGTPGFPNLISGNNGFGIYVSGTNTSNNNIQSNLIGTNSGGNADLGNAFDGIYFVSGTYDNLVGGTGANEGNLIAYNANGIKADSGIRNAFRRNRVFLNDSLGIDLAPAGVTPNDANDGDAGPNNLQNYPVITYVNAQASSLTLNGTFNSTPNQTFTIEFFGNIDGVDPTGFGEGRNFLGSTQVTTNAGGNAFFTGLNFAAARSSVGSWVTATATDALGNTSEFSQARNPCAGMAFSPTDVIAPIGGGAANFTVTYSSGCNSYSAQSNVGWITVNSVNAGTVNYTVAANTTPPRDGLININYNNGTGAAVQSFLISQNNGCTYPYSHSTANYTAAGTSSDGMSVGAGTGCLWTAVSNAPWINITSGANYSGFATVMWSVPANTGPARQGTLTIAGQTFTINQAAGSARKAPFDYDGDGKTDASVYRPSSGDWYLLRSTSGFAAYHFGSPSDIMTPADYTGDGKTDVAVWRPSTGIWYVLRSENFTFYGAGFGTNGDIPAPGDYDGDGMADLVVYRPGAQGYWYLQQSQAGFAAVPFGIAEDKPALGDYDGDGKFDISVYRPSVGNWYRFNSSNGSFYGVHFGVVGDMIVPGDYTGDGKTDNAVFRPSSSTWFILRSESPTFYSAGFGAAGDLPTPGDYDGDGKTDLSVWRPGAQGTFFIQQSTAGFTAIPWGLNGDRPTPNVYVY